MSESHNRTAVNRRRVALAALLALAGLVAAAVAAVPARAAFPGDNGKFAYTSDPTGLDLEVYSMNADGSGQTDLTNRPDDTDSAPTWSPDGQKIAFSTDRNLNDEIYVMNADGTNPIDLTLNAASDTSPSWSGNGQKLAFTSDRDGNFNLEIYAMNADGSGQTRLTTTSDLVLDTGAAWSPDAQSIAFTSTRDGNSEVYVMNADGSGQTNRTNNAATDTAPDWSPDGQKIAFASRRDGNAEIYVMNADGTSPTRLTTNSTSDFSPAWSPDGQKIVFRSNRDGNGYEIYSMNAGGSAQTRLTNNTFLDTDPDWQPLPFAGYLRPKGATPMLVSLVPAYQPCAAANRAHGGGLVFASCNPAAQSSPNVTVGTPDANGAVANMAGSARFDVCPVPGCTAPNVQMYVNVADVRCQSTGPSFCASTNTAGGADYAGELRAELPLRITDRYNGLSLTEGATVSDTSFGVTIPCSETSTDATKGATCSIATTANAIVPNSVLSGQRAIWEIGQIAVKDGGSDGDGDTTGDNQPFLRQGVFVP